MNSKTFYAFCFVLAVGLAVVKADEYNSEEQYDEIPDKELKALKDEKPEEHVEKTDKDTNAPGQHSGTDPDTIKNKGLCHWGIKQWYKAGYQTRCNCMRCTCGTGGKWDCAYHFAYCPYYYCGNVIYNPKSQTCCCGKVYDTKSNWNCCGYYYYNSRTSKCCNYYSVKSKHMNCPRHKIE